jgi:hypothetical protein
MGERGGNELAKGRGLGAERMEHRAWRNSCSYSFSYSYEIRGNLQGSNGRILSVVTIWMAEIATGQTKFVTRYPAKGAKYGRL